MVRLAGLLLLRSLLQRCRSLGLREVRLVAECEDLPLLRAAIASGFRPVEVSPSGDKVAQTLIAHPQLQEPNIAAFRQKAAALGTLNNDPL